MEATVFYLLMLQKLSVQSKRLLEETISIVFRNISKAFKVNNLKKKTGLNGYGNDVPVDHNSWPKTCNFIKKETRVQCFPVNFANFQRTPFPTEHLQWLFLVLG